MQKNDLRTAFLAADSRIRNLMGDRTTSLKSFPPEKGRDYTVDIKMETETEIHSFKLRGAYNAIATVQETTNTVRELVAASAGNHAQGVAYSAQKLGLYATIFMPKTTPQTKIDAVRKFGGKNVSVELVGNSYDEASKAAKNYVTKSGGTFIHPFDNIDTIAGQSTVASEAITQNADNAPFDYAFIQIGGGGLAAGMAVRLKEAYPNIKIIGVEGNDQASMKASLEAGKVTEIHNVDNFCDGTAVRLPGEMTFDICKDALDGIITVTNDEVSAAVKECWDLLRTVPEPSGAMGYAGLTKFAKENPEDVCGAHILTVLSGANVDFVKIGSMAAQAAVGAHQKQFFRFRLNEERGNLLQLLDDMMEDLNVTDFLYGKNDPAVAHPVIGFGASPEQLVDFEHALQNAGIAFENVTNNADIRYRNIPYSPRLLRDSHFFEVNFFEHVGALGNLLKEIKDIAELSYFNYSYTGENVGRALMGFNTDDLDGLTRKIQIHTESAVKPPENVVANIKNIDIKVPVIQQHQPA